MKQNTISNIEILFYNFELEFFLFHCNMKWVVKFMTESFEFSLYRPGQVKRKRYLKISNKKFHNQVLQSVIFIKIRYIFLLQFFFFSLFLFLKITYFSKCLVFSSLLLLGKENLIQENLNPDFLFIRWHMPCRKFSS